MEDAGALPIELDVNQMNMGDDDSQLSEPVGTASKSEQKEKVGEIKGLIEDVMAAAKSGEALDDENTQKLKLMKLITVMNWLQLNSVIKSLMVIKVSKS